MAWQRQEKDSTPGGRMHDDSTPGHWNCHNGSMEEPFLNFKRRGSDPDRDVRKLKVDDLCLTLTEGRARVKEGLEAEEERRGPGEMVLDT